MTARSTPNTRFGRHRRLLGALASVLILACAPVQALTLREDQPLRIVALGDSLIAGYGLSVDDSFPVQLERRLRAVGVEATVINGAVSGDTTAGGLARLGWVLGDDPNLMIVCLGANDGLRGIDPADTRANLDAILEEITSRDIPVLLSGMLAPPNLGRRYAAAFNPLFGDLATKYDAKFDPFFLEGVAAEPHLNQSDGIHPNPDGVAIIADRLLPQVLSLAAEAGLIDPRAP